MIPCQPAAAVGVCVCVGSTVGEGGGRREGGGGGVPIFVTRLPLPPGAITLLLPTTPNCPPPTPLLRSDVDQIIRDLVDIAVGQTRTKMRLRLRERISTAVEERLLDLLLDGGAPRKLTLAPARAPPPLFRPRTFS